MPGRLFTEYFLTDGIRTTARWAASDAALDEFRSAAAEAYERLESYDRPNEAVTEQELILPVLKLLGWADHLPQQGASRSEDIPDNLVFTDTESKDHAAALPSTERYRQAAVVQESKRFDLPLDASGGEPRPRRPRGNMLFEMPDDYGEDDADSERGARKPHSQILRYLSTAEIESDGRLRWGILTNGRVWRIYDARTRPRATAYFEAYLDDVLDPDREHDLRVFYLLFHRDSFVLTDGATTTFLEDALAEGKRYEEQVAQDLSTVVFDRVFPGLVMALYDASGSELEEVRQAALVFLYRLLFILYAEDRGLLPVNDRTYESYGLRRPVRDAIAERMLDNDVLYSDTATNYYDHVMTLCRLIDRGDPSIRLPAYDGGLFSSDAAPILEQVRLPDSAVAPLLYDLSHSETPEGARFVNYRDMSVQQLGSIYERLLEREPVLEGGAIDVRLNPYARKDSGSFYTPQELVDLVIEKTLEPLVDERRDAFAARAAELKSDRRPKDRRLADLAKLDPAGAVLDLKVLDPAMGSGHFLVTAVDFLADHVADLVEDPPEVKWLDGGYVSPLVERIEAIRKSIRRNRGSGRVRDRQAPITDQDIIRRMVLKRCIYGVDKNPMTVELAKVSLWLHSFTVGAPLSFLDHHLRCGDSLVGMRVGEAADELNRLGGLFSSSAIAGAEAAVRGMLQIEAMSDAEVSEVHESASLFSLVEKETADPRKLLDFLCGLRWLTAGMKKRQRDDFERPVVDALVPNAEESFDLLVHGPEAVDAETSEEQAGPFEEIWRRARTAARGEAFLHWETAFPGVWHGWQDANPQGGFDAVIGNPPWDRIKLQEVEWFAPRDSEIAHLTTAAARKSRIQWLRDTGTPMADDFDAAKRRADTLGALVRGSGHYPLLGGGDINLYSLFVERATRLVKPDGIVGLLTPSGIYADKTAAPFFRAVSTGGRVAGLFDFENRRPKTGLPHFFPDVDSRFKFCVLVFGGDERRFPETPCAFFLHNTATVNDPERCFPLAPSHFAQVNPNTGTAPVFRTRRDAEITRSIYERHPVLVDRSGDEVRRMWPVRYVRMFDMTNDSRLFRRASELQAEGYYPVQGNLYRRGKESFLPLYEGKMVQAFDHRAASVAVNPENLNRPAQPRDASPDEHANPNWLPSPQYWVPASECSSTLGSNWVLGFKDITSPTNIRTFIAALFPAVAFGNKVPILMSETKERTEWLLAANFNAVVFDFSTRQKLQGQTLNWYIVEQLPVIAPDDYDRQFGDTSARDLVRDHVLRLTYTAHDMAPFARDLAYDGEPFTWDEEERRHLRGRLDALYFHLYGLDKDDAEYVLGTFPIVRRDDEKQFGSYRTRDLVLAYMDALAAGDTDSQVAI